MDYPIASSEDYLKADFLNVVPFVYEDMRQFFGPYSIDLEKSEILDLPKRTPFEATPSVTTISNHYLEHEVCTLIDMDTSFDRLIWVRLGMDAANAGYVATGGYSDMEVRMQKYLNCDLTGVDYGGTPGEKWYGMLYYQDPVQMGYGGNLVKRYVTSNTDNHPDIIRPASIVVSGTGLMISEREYGLYGMIHQGETQKVYKIYLDEDFRNLGGTYQETYINLLDNGSFERPFVTSGWNLNAQADDTLLINGIDDIGTVIHGNSGMAAWYGKHFIKLTERADDGNYDNIVYERIPVSSSQWHYFSFHVAKTSLDSPTVSGANWDDSTYLKATINYKNSVGSTISTITGDTFNSDLDFSTTWFRVGVAGYAHFTAVTAELQLGFVGPGTTQDIAYVDAVQFEETDNSDDPQTEFIDNKGLYKSNRDFDILYTDGRKGYNVPLWERVKFESIDINGSYYVELKDCTTLNYHNDIKNLSINKFVCIGSH